MYKNRILLELQERSYACVCKINKSFSPSIPPIQFLFPYAPNVSSNVCAISFVDVFLFVFIFLHAGWKMSPNVGFGRRNDT